MLLLIWRSSGNYSSIVPGPSLLVLQGLIMCWVFCRPAQGTICYLSQVLVLPSPPRSRNNVNNNPPALTPPSAARRTSSSPLTTDLRTVLPAGPAVLSTCSALLQLTLELSVPPLHALGQAPRPSSLPARLHCVPPDDQTIHRSRPAACPASHSCLVPFLNVVPRVPSLLSLLLRRRLDFPYRYCTRGPLSCRGVWCAPACLFLVDCQPACPPWPRPDLALPDLICPASQPQVIDPTCAQSQALPSPFRCPAPFLSPPPPLFKAFLSPSRSL